MGSRSRGLAGALVFGATAGLACATATAAPKAVEPSLVTLQGETMGSTWHVKLVARDDAEAKRVVYQPVTIEAREITPRIIREENYGGL